MDGSYINFFYSSFLCTQRESFFLKYVLKVSTKQAASHERNLRHQGFVVEANDDKKMI